MTGKRECAVEMMRDLGMHDLGLLHDLVGEWTLMAACFIRDHAQRGFERVREIADVGARPVDDLAVRLDQRVKLALQRPDLIGNFSLERFRLA